MFRLIAMLVLIAAAFLMTVDPVQAQDPALSSLKARQAKERRKEASEAERQQTIKVREAEIILALESAVVNLGKQGIEFRQLSDSDACLFEKDCKIVGQGANRRVIHITTGLFHTLKLVIQPRGGNPANICWEFKKDGSFEIGERLGYGGQVFFTGKNFLDPLAVTPNQSKIQHGLLKYVSATVK